MLSVHSCPLGKLGTRDTGGMSVYVRELVRELGARGWAVDVFTRQHPCCAWPGTSLGEGVRLVHLPVADGETKLGVYPYLPDFTCAVHRYKAEQGVDYHLIHSHYWLSGWVGAVLARWWGAPHITALHTSARAKNHHLGWAEETELRIHTEGEVLAAADRIIATSPQEREELLKYYGVPGDKVAVAPAGVDLDLFRPWPRPESRRRLGLTGDRVILFVGRLEPSKGVELLLKAVALLECPDQVQVVVVGGELDGDGEVDRLRHLAARWGIDELVCFRGTVEQEELPFYYSAADVCVLPSRYETFGLVTLEALACGTPVIATRVGCAEEVIRPGKNGWLLDEPSAPHLARLLHRVLSQGLAGEGFSSRYRASVAGLTWSTVAERVAEHYRSLVG